MGKKALLDWVAVKELELSYSKRETLFCTMIPIIRPII